MKTLLITFAGLFLLSFGVEAQNSPDIFSLSGKKTINPKASSFEFEISNMGMFNAKGTMGGIKGYVNFDKINTDEFVMVSLDVKTIDTGVKKRDEHLKTADFFDAPNHPNITFKGGKVSELAGDVYFVSGKLTMRGVTLAKKVPIKLKVEGDKVFFTGAVKVDRSKYGIDGGSTVGDEAEVTYTIQAE